MIFDLKGRKAFNWCFLVLLSLVLALGLKVIGCPAWQMIGPMLGGVISSCLGRASKIEPLAFNISQGFIGALVARGISSHFWLDFSSAWPYFIGGTLWGIFLGGVLGLFLYLRRQVEADSAFWCLSPGGATVMMLLAGQYGGDMRIVGFTQYFRVVVVSICAVIISSLWLGASATSGPMAAGLMAAVNPYDFLLTLAAVLLGLFLSRYIRIPGALLLLPMFSAVIFKNALGVNLTFPLWLLYPCYALVGWRIGLAFTPETLARIVKIIPGIFLSVLIMVAGCALFAYIMVVGADFDPLTAYLATSPGGLDAVTIIAVSSGGDLSIIMAMQATRLILVITTGPWFYGYLTRRFTPTRR
ncbi:MAG: AbrB family transcriptional regulator [Deltaproteobacteria bacterium]|nr:AbrB family transcriptional regulator [Deltaproteobacteria bacterium]